MIHLTTEKMQVKMEEVLKADPRMILTFRSKLVTEEMWEYAVSMEPALFQECKNKTYRIASSAIMADGFNLEHCDPIKYTGEQYKKLCTLAVRQNPKAVVIVPKAMRRSLPILWWRASLTTAPVSFSTSSTPQTI